MGLFGFVGRACAAVWGGAKKVVKATYEGAKKVVKATCKGVKKAGAAIQAGWEKFTGRDKEREAEALLAAMEEKAKAKEKEFFRVAENVQQRISASVGSINQVRVKLNEHYFVRFEELASNFSTWEVDKTRFEIANVIKAKNMETLKTRSELFKIDFRNSPITSNLKALVSFGFWSRKQAKESLLAVKEENHRLDYEIEQLNAEEKRLQLLAESLEAVVTYMQDFCGYYGKILDELDYSVNLLRRSYNIQTRSEAPAQMDPAMLPERHQYCLQCADTATRIMFTVGNFQYIKSTEKDLKAIEHDFRAFQENRAELETMQQQFAA